MRAVVKAHAAFGAELLTVPFPTIGPRDVLVKVRATTICGTDLHIYRWDTWAQSRIKPPMVFGHEFSGDIVAVGDEVASVKIGDYISGETHIICGHCYPCRTGQYHICRNVKIIGRAASPSTSRCRPRTPGATSRISIRRSPQRRSRSATPCTLRSRPI
jgi:threonine 3-dehydrogenase